jgi:hypothetical protein
VSERCDSFFRAGGLNAQVNWKSPNSCCNFVSMCSYIDCKEIAKQLDIGITLPLPVPMAGPTA